MGGLLTVAGYGTLPSASMAMSPAGTSRPYTAKGLSAAILQALKLMEILF
jgi:hypothetical protein